MKLLRLLPVALIFASALRAEPHLPVAGAPYELSLPNGWTPMPQAQLDFFRHLSPDEPSDYTAGYAGPRTPQSTAITIMLVQVLPADMTPQDYLEHASSTLTGLQASHPERGIVRDLCRVGLNDRALVTGMHSTNGKAVRLYAFPTSKGLIEFVLFSPPESAAATFAAMESCLVKLRLTAGGNFDSQWISEMKKTLPPPTKRVY